MSTSDKLREKTVDKIERQSNEFNAVEEICKRLNALSSVVDNNYPENRHRYEVSMNGLIESLIANGRISRHSFYGDVLEFHSKFDLPHPDNISARNLTREEFDFRFGFMSEELIEYSQAWLEGDLVGAADALVDLIYVALGTAAFHGFPLDQVWAVVHEANMSKVRTPSKDASKRSSTLDVIKPDEWVSPNDAIRKIIDGAK